MATLYQRKRKGRNARSQERRGQRLAGEIDWPNVSSSYPSRPWTQRTIASDAGNGFGYRAVTCCRLCLTQQSSPVQDGCRLPVTMGTEPFRRVVMYLRALLLLLVLCGPCSALLSGAEPGKTDSPLDKLD